MIKFRRFTFDRTARSLMCLGNPVALGSRAFDLLCALVEARGTLVSKDSLVKYVWPTTFVEESNLRFQMASLRKALGIDRDVIKTIPGRGYLFVADGVSTSEEGDLPAAAHESFARRHPDRRAPVAIVEDDESVRESLENLLLSAGLSVEAYASTQDFLKRETRSVPSCLVLDVWLPGQSGLDFQSELVKFGLGLPVIFISGEADVPMSVRAMKAGAVEFLTKPVRHRDLLDAVYLAIGSGTA